LPSISSLASSFLSATLNMEHSQKYVFVHTALPHRTKQHCGNSRPKSVPFCMTGQMINQRERNGGKFDGIAWKVNDTYIHTYKFV